MSLGQNQICIFVSYSEQDAYRLQEKLHLASVDAMLLQQNENSPVEKPKLALYVPFHQVEKAKLLIQKLHE